MMPSLLSNRHRNQPIFALQRLLTRSETQSIQAAGLGLRKFQNIGVFIIEMGAVAIFIAATTWSVIIFFRYHQSISRPPRSRTIREQSTSNKPRQKFGRVWCSSPHVLYSQRTKTRLPLYKLHIGRHPTTENPNFMRRTSEISHST